MPISSYWISKLCKAENLALIEKENLTDKFNRIFVFLHSIRKLKLNDVVVISVWGYLMRNLRVIFKNSFLCISVRKLNEKWFLDISVKFWLQGLLRESSPNMFCVSWPVFDDQDKSNIRKILLREILVR